MLQSILRGVGIPSGRTVTRRSATKTRVSDPVDAGIAARLCTLGFHLIHFWTGLLVSQCIERGTCSRFLYQVSNLDDAIYLRY
jgi:hypothetical protein